MNPKMHVDSPITCDDLDYAVTTLEGNTVYTPLLESPALNSLLGGRVLLKAETLQHTGSFKFRGAFYSLSQFSKDQLKKGVVAFSSGNHAQAVAAAAKIFGTNATIIMPEDAPHIKQDNTKKFGAKVVLYDRENEDREAIAKAISDVTGAALVPPFDALNTILGQSTVGSEIVQQCNHRKLVPDQFLVCCGGGGLTAGSTLAIKRHFLQTDCYAVEPAAFNDTELSLLSGNRVGRQSDDKSFCDALLTPIPGEITFAINKQTLSGVLTVDDDEVLHAIAYGLNKLKLVIEPGGAVCLAAALAGRLTAKTK